MQICYLRSLKSNPVSLLFERLLPTLGKTQNILRYAAIWGWLAHDGQSLDGLQYHFLLGYFLPVTDAVIELLSLLAPCWVIELLSLLADEFTLLGALEESSALCLWLRVFFSLGPSCSHSVALWNGLFWTIVLFLTFLTLEFLEPSGWFEVVLYWYFPLLMLLQLGNLITASHKLDAGSDLPTRSWHLVTWHVGTELPNGWVQI